MVTKKVSKQSWTALLEHDQLQICLSVDKQRIIRLSSQLFFEQWRPNIVKFDAVARHRERSSFQLFWPTLHKHVP